jgi:hypothetical protein
MKIDPEKLADATGDTKYRLELAEAIAQMTQKELLSYDLLLYGMVCYTVDARGKITRIDPRRITVAPED